MHFLSIFGGYSRYSPSALIDSFKISKCFFSDIVSKMYSISLVKHVVIDYDITVRVVAIALKYGGPELVVYDQKAKKYVSPCIETNYIVSLFISMFNESCSGCPIPRTCDD